MKRWGNVLIQCVLVILLAYFLFWRWQVSQTRFFDVDEFSYLHWAAELVKGQRPYTDFFMFFTPGFLWFFAPLIRIFWMDPNVFLAARTASFFIFIGILGSLGYLFGITRGWKWALVPAILLAFLPMPYDKFLEVRPDNLATLLAMIGVIGEIGAIGGKKNWWFLSGFFYALSLLVFVKTLPFVVVGAGVALCSHWGDKGNRGNREDMGRFAAGLGIPMVLFFLWTLTLGDFGVVLYSLTRLPFEANMMGTLDHMEPNLFFWPNASFYGLPAQAGGWGFTPGLLANHAIWIIGIFMGVYRLFTPFLTAQGDRKRVLVELLTGGTFVLLVFGYVQFFPLKHSQYLIPISVFVAYYCADFFVEIGRRIGGIGVIGAIGGVWVLGSATVQVNAPKLAWSNAAQMKQMQRLITTIPASQPVLDLEGRMLFWPDAYTICCVPFGSFTQFMSRKPRSLIDTLEKGQTPYMFQGETGRLNTLSGEDQAYIRSYFSPVDGWEEALWRRIDNKQ